MKNISFNKIPFEGDQKLRLSISCSATFDQLFRFGATFSPSSNLSDFVQLFSFLNNFQLLELQLDPYVIATHF